MLEQAVIIAGGKGSRVKPLLNSTPKILLDIENEKLIDFQIDYLYSNNINKIHFCLGFGSEEILEHLTKRNIDYTYSLESKPLGTYGALANAKKYLDSKFFVLYGDILTNFNIQKGYEKFKELKSDFHLIVRYTNHPEDSDIVLLSEKKQVLNITRSEELDFPYMPLGNTAIFFGTKKAISQENQNFPIDVFKDYIKSNIKNYKITGSISSDYIRDIGTVDRYKKEIFDFRDKIKSSQKVALFDRDGTLIHDQGNENNPSKLTFKEDILKVIEYLQKNYYKIFMISNQPGIAKGFFTSKDVEKFNAKLQHELIKNGLNPLDGIYICPHHPEKGHKGEIKKLKITCTCRKPQTGLFDQLLNDNNFENSNFIFLGDTIVDYEFSLKLNIPFYLIESNLTEKSEFEKKDIVIYKKSKDLISEIEKAK